jgi:hypothetical protein
MAINTDQAQPQRPTRPNAPGGKSTSNTLARHQQFEQVATGLVGHSDERLNSLGGALLSQRQQAVSKFADFLEKVQDGTVDLTLLGEELAQRAATRQQSEAVFTVQASSFEVRDFEVKPDMVKTLTGQAFTKALEGI